MLACNTVMGTLTPPTALPVLTLPTALALSPVETPAHPVTMLGNDGTTMVYVPAGEFTMGSNVDDAIAECQKFYGDCQTDRFINEEPPHIVTLDAFWIDQTEMTNKKYALCVSDGGCIPPSSTNSSVHASYYGNSNFDNYPVIYVSWDMANAYCSWAGKRLPTEAEWEKAARGTDARIYPWGDNPPNNKLLNYYNFGGTTAVSRYPDGASFYGIYNMAGNVWEWVNDRYSNTYYQSSPSFNPLGPDFGQTRVLRGGSWRDMGYITRTTYRLGLESSYADFYLGFRCSRSEEVQNILAPVETHTHPVTMLGKDGATLVYVPEGEFTMGSDADDALAECQKFRTSCNRDSFTNEEPSRIVTLDAFWIDQTEVTNAMYAQCVLEGVCKKVSTKSDTHPSYYGNSEFDNYPVINVNWNMANTYCSWADRRLPTESEWEKAARGAMGRIYPWGNTFDGSVLNFCDINCSLSWANKSFNDGYADVSPVGNYPSGQSIYGAYDMGGNVKEWVDDWLDDSHQSKVMRGGSWNYYDIDARAASRNWVDPIGSGDDLGFRCSLSQ